MCAQTQRSTKIRIILETELIPLLLKYPGKYGWITFKFCSIHARDIQEYSELPGPCLLTVTGYIRNHKTHFTGRYKQPWSEREETGEISF